jgi:hypothetical protein
MYDVELLMNPSPRLRKIIVYNYEDGYFKPGVVRYLNERRGSRVAVEAEGYLLPLLSREPLFGENFVLAELSRFTAKDVESSLGAIAEGKYRGVVLFFAKSDWLAGQAAGLRDAYVKVSGKASVLDEVSASSKAGLQALVRSVLYWGGAGEFGNSKEFVDTLVDFFLKQKIDSISKCYNLIDYFYCLCVDEGGFQAKLFSEHGAPFFGGQNQFAAIGGEIYNFLSMPSAVTRDALFSKVDGLVNGGGYAVRQIMGMVHKTVLDLFLVSSQLNPTLGKPKDYHEYYWKRLLNFSSVKTKNLLLFSLVFAMHEERLNVGNFLSEFFVFCKAFLDLTEKGSN